MKLIEFSSLNSMKLKSVKKNHFIFDIFITNKELYFVGPAISGFNINLLSIYNNDTELILKKNFTTFKTLEDFMLLIYECSNEESVIDIHVKYRDEIEKFKILNQTNLEIKHKLSITTLCSKDYKIFPMWHEYYKKQGVDHFFIYFNGIIEDKISYFDYDDVTLVEWPFKYWRPNVKGKHNAQPAHMNHSLYLFGKPTSEYMIFCDLDEFLQTHLGKEIPNDMISIKQLLLNKPHIDIITFRNLWARTIDNKIPESFPDNFLVSQHIQQVERKKNLYRTSKINAVSIHSIHIKWNKNMKFLHMYGMFFHFYNWSRNFRQILEKKPFILIKPDL